MSYQTTKEFWTQQAEKFGNDPEATTNDFYLREIEVRVISEIISNLKSDSAKIADVGCGNGYSTKRHAKSFSQHSFIGYDYVPEMIENARLGQSTDNIKFDVLDLVNDSITSSFDLIFTNRCLINLPTWEDQQTALEKIHASLSDGGTFAMVENFVEGQSNFNQLRREFGLSEIPIRHHNLFFNKKMLTDFIEDKFEIVRSVNISSQYYITSRIIYSKICQENGDSPDYRDIHHKLGSMLPFEGDCGPINLWELKKR